MIFDQEILKTTKTKFIFDQGIVNNWPRKLLSLTKNICNPWLTNIGQMLIISVNYWPKKLSISNISLTKIWPKPLTNDICFLTDDIQAVTSLGISVALVKASHLPSPISAVELKICLSGFSVPKDGNIFWSIFDLFVFLSRIRESKRCLVSQIRKQFW